jgi:electron transport complex protein RnfG
MLRAMVGIGLLCGLLIVTVFQLTRPVIARNRAEALERAIFEVLPQARTSRSFGFTGEGFAPLGGEGTGDGDGVVHAGYDAQGRLVGLAVEAAGMGYQDEIRLLYGYAPGREAIVGIRVLESRETPGLGDRIESDPDFLANFEQLDVALVEGGDRIANPIVAVGHGEKRHAFEVDGITGATISSVAVADILRRSTAVWVPRMRRDLADFEGAR